MRCFGTPWLRNSVGTPWFLLKRCFAVKNHMLVYVVVIRWDSWVQDMLNGEL